MHAGADAVEHAAEHEVEDQAEKTALKVAAGDGASEPMEVVRTIQKGEHLSDILDEAKTGMYLTGKEHAVVTLADGTRALVRGGRYGIDFGEDTIKNILFHTHPWDDLARGPSPADFNALKQLGQASSHIYEHGQWFKFWNRAMFP